MSNLRRELGREIDGFFDSVESGERTEMEMGRFVQDLAPPDVLYTLLDEVERDPAGAADPDYSFNIGFDRITFSMSETKGSKARWRFRSHLFDPAIAGDHREPVHFHKWTLGSYAVCGSIQSDYFFVTDIDGRPMPPRARRATALPDNTSAQPKTTRQDLETAIPMCYYTEAGSNNGPGKLVAPRLIGRCLLTKEFTHVVPSGSAYTQSVDLAHGVRLSRSAGPVLTAALMGPAVYQDSVFLEETPDFPARPAPQPFDLDCIAALASRMKTMIQTTSERVSAVTPSPWPDFLAIYSAQHS